MQRLSVVDKRSGAPLFDRIWSWKEDQQDPSAAAKIIQLFFHFAKEVCVMVSTNRAPQEGDSLSLSLPAIRSAFWLMCTAVSPRHATQVDRGDVTRVIFDSIGQTKRPKKRTNYTSKGVLGGMQGGGGKVQRSLESIRSRTVEMWCSHDAAVILAIFVATDDFKVC